MTNKINFTEVSSVSFEYGSKNTKFIITNKEVTDLTNKKEFNLHKAYDGKINFNNIELYESGRKEGITIEPSYDVYEIVKAMIGAKELGATLVKFDEDRFIERSWLKKNGLGKTFKLGNDLYAYKYN